MARWLETALIAESTMPKVRVAASTEETSIALAACNSLAELVAKKKPVFAAVLVAAAVDVVPKVLAESSVIWPVTEELLAAAAAPADPAMPVCRPTSSTLVAADRFMIRMSLPVALVNVIPVAAVFNLAVTPVVEDLSLKAVIALARPSALFAVTVKDRFTAEALSESRSME